jgi:hypothetical protein
MCCWVGGVDWLCESLPSVSAVASRPFYDVECLEVGSSITVHKTETRGFFLEHYDLGEIGPTNISARSPYYSMGPLQFYGVPGAFPMDCSGYRKNALMSFLKCLLSSIR